MTAAHALLSVGFNTAIAELDSIINRRFASQRTIRVKQRDHDGWYAAYMDDGTARFPYCPNLDTVIAFVRAFAEKEGVQVDEDSIESDSPPIGQCRTARQLFKSVFRCECLRS
jgi:hypothetical protein